MKKIALCLAAVMSLISLTACSNTAADEILSEDESSAAVSVQISASEETTQSTASETASEMETESVSATAESSETAVPSKPLNGLEYVLAESFAPIYEKADFREDFPDGVPTTYEELLDFFPSYSNVSFLEYEIISQYTSEEAVEKTGDEVFNRSATLYQAHIYYDHLHDMPVDMTVDLAKAGVPGNQLENNPPYVIGQKLISDLSGFDSTSCVAVPELVYFVYEVNGVDLAYHVDHERIAIESEDFPNLDIEMAESELFLVTTTANNPVKFTQKSTVEDLTAFIRQDWEKRGYEFFDAANFDYEGRTVLDPNEDVPVIE